MFPTITIGLVDRGRALDWRIVIVVFVCDCMFLVFSCRCPWCCQIHHLGDVHYRLRAARNTRLACSRYLHLALSWLSRGSPTTRVESSSLIEARCDAPQGREPAKYSCTNSPKKYKTGVLLRWAAVMDTVRSGHWVGTHCYITF